MTPAVAPLDRIHEHLDRGGAGSFALLKPAFLERRLQIRFRAVGVADMAAYADRLDRDPSERRRLAGGVGLGVTGFFRDPPVWTWLAGGLAGWPGGACRGWSAGTATGEEAWSLASVMADLADRGRLGDWRVLGSDIDGDHIEVAERGEYPGRRRPAYADRVTFERDDLTVHRTRGPYDVVLCRNVMIYFGAEGQRRMLESLWDALDPGGLLVLGKAEFVGPDWRDRLTLVDRQERVYRRIG